MDTNEKPRRPWWKKGRWRVVIAFWFALPSFYLPSAGPACYAVTRGWLPWSIYLPLYDGPMYELRQSRYVPVAVKKWSSKWVGWCSARAHEHNSGRPIPPERWPPGFTPD